MIIVWNEEGATRTQRGGKRTFRWDVRCGCIRTRSVDHVKTSLVGRLQPSSEERGMNLIDMEGMFLHFREGRLRSFVAGGAMPLNEGKARLASMHQAGTFLWRAPQTMRRKLEGTTAAAGRCDSGAIARQEQPRQRGKERLA